MGGINAIRNRQSLPDVRQYVYGDKAEWYDTYPARAISQVIAVDAVIRSVRLIGSFVRVVTVLLQGRQPKLPDYPMCIECKLHENICVRAGASVPGADYPGGLQRHLPGVWLRLRRVPRAGLCARHESFQEVLTAALAEPIRN
ncbi:MAG: hypothetical protein R3D55_00965 [Chloroflexota bacterium]